jgi:hypothetical protein
MWGQAVRWRQHNIYVVRLKQRLLPHITSLQQVRCSGSHSRNCRGPACTKGRCCELSQRHPKTRGGKILLHATQFLLSAPVKVRTHTTHMVNRHLQIPLPHNHIPCSNTHKTLPCRNGHWHLGIHPLQDINHRPPASMTTCYIVTPACRKLAGSLQEAWPTGSSTAGLAA